MRSPRCSRWVWAACALAIALPASSATADRGAREAPVQRSVNECASFDQVARAGGDGADLSVRNACEMPLSCTVTWALTCAPKVPSRRSRSRGRSVFALEVDATRQIEASASRCGDDDWSLHDVSWTCRPEPDGK